VVVSDMSAALSGPPPGSELALSRAAVAAEAASRLLSAAASSNVCAAVRHSYFMFLEGCSRPTVPSCVF
jgi:hypothetical protein